MFRSFGITFIYFIWIYLLFYFTQPHEANDAHTHTFGRTPKPSLLLMIRSDAAALPWARIKRTVACRQLGTTEEDHDPSVSAHTRHRGRELRVVVLRVSRRRAAAPAGNARRAREPRLPRPPPLHILMPCLCPFCRRRL